MSNRLQKEHLNLYRCIVDDGAEIVRTFTEEKLEAKFNNSNLYVILNDLKHHFYHQWERKKTYCCMCPVHGCSIPRPGNMDPRRFSKMYKYDTSIKTPKDHNKKQNGIVEQKCICCLITQNITYTDFDICDLNYILTNVGIVSNGSPESIALTKVMEIRGTIMHALSTDQFNSHNISTLWNQFEASILQLVQPASTRIAKRLLSRTRNSMLSEEECKDFLDALELRNEQILETEIGKLTESTLPDMEDRITNKIIGYISERLNQLETTIQLQIDKETEATGIDRTMSVDVRVDSTVLKEELAKESLSKQTTPIEEACKPDDDDYIHMNSVKINCLLIEASCSSKIFRSETVLRAAIRSLILKVIDAGEVDTNKESRMCITFTIKSPLTAVEKETVFKMLSKYDNGSQTEPLRIDAAKEIKEMEHLAECSNCAELKALLSEKNATLLEQEQFICKMKATLTKEEDKTLKKDIKETEEYTVSPLLDTPEPDKTIGEMKRLFIDDEISILMGKVEDKSGIYPSADLSKRGKMATSRHRFTSSICVNAGIIFVPPDGISRSLKDIFSLQYGFDVQEVDIKQILFLDELKEKTKGKDFVLIIDSIIDYFEWSYVLHRIYRHIPVLLITKVFRDWEKFSYEHIAKNQVVVSMYPKRMFDEFVDKFGDILHKQPTGSVDLISVIASSARNILLEKFVYDMSFSIHSHFSKQILLSKRSSVQPKLPQLPKTDLEFQTVMSEKERKIQYEAPRIHKYDTILTKPSHIQRKISEKRLDISSKTSETTYHGSGSTAPID